MKLNIITVGKPKLNYAKIGFEFYVKRLKHFYDTQIIPIPDNKANEKYLDKITNNIFLIALDVEGEIMSSRQLAKYLNKITLQQKEIYFIIGGPDGLPPSIINKANFKWSLSRLTFPHDMATLIVSESLFRAASINQNLPYHK